MKGDAKYKRNTRIIQAVFAVIVLVISVVMISQTKPPQTNEEIYEDVMAADKKMQSMTCQELKGYYMENYEGPPDSDTYFGLAKGWYQTYKCDLGELPLDPWTKGLRWHKGKHAWIDPKQEIQDTVDNFFPK